MYAHREEFRIDRMAKVLEVSESGYYKWLKRRTGPMTKKEVSDQLLTKEIFTEYCRSRGSYGSRKITGLINVNHERPVNHKRVERLMRENALRSRTRKKYVCTTDSNHDYPIAENILKRDFTVNAPNEKMLSDTTEVDTAEGKLYIAGIIDLYGRLPVGFAISTRNDRYLVIEAFNDMLLKGYGKEGCILHSDRGSTYCCEDYRELLKKHGFVCSMSRKGDCWDNAPMESFWGKMKTEWLKSRYSTRAEAIRDIYEYIWTFYSRERPHEANGYLTPMQFYTAV